MRKNEKSKLILFVAVLCTLIFCAFSCSVSTAKLSEATMAQGVDLETQEPTGKTDVFTSDVSEIFCSVKISNAPHETKVKAGWYYLEEGEELEIDSYALEVEGSRYISFSLVGPTAGWPTGSYEVRLYLNDELTETVPFTVK